jgi:two-component system C4-dicarboxylate transport sensor histidine kinase DctB
VIAGAGYGTLNRLFDSWDRGHPLIDTLATLHDVIDRGVPVLVGTLLGLAVHWLTLRSALARSERQRAEDLHGRLLRIERDQAVWVVATATLHDVQNPLHTAGLLLDEAVLLEGDEQRAFVERARGHMARVASGFAALRRLASAARPSLGPVLVDSVVEDVVRDLGPLAERDGVKLAVHMGRPLQVQGDATFVRIILENLVANSLDGLRGRGHPGHVEVEMARTGDQVAVRVRDDGPGMDHALRSTVFEPLRTTKPQGLGLGLAIARALARAMKGDVVLEDEPGWATTFLLLLPLPTTVP